MVVGAHSVGMVGDTPVQVLVGLRVGSVRPAPCLHSCVMLESLKRLAVASDASWNAWARRSGDIMSGRLYLLQ